MLTAFSRFILYGGNSYDMKKKPTLLGWFWGHGQNFLRRRFGLHEVSAPGLVDFTRHYLDKYVLEWLGIGNRGSLPKGWPADVFNTIDRIIKARGGQVAVGDLTIPAFSLNRKTALTLTTMWVAYVDFNGDSANFNAVKGLEEALEDAIARECKKELNLRVLTKPARIEIDRTDTPTITLRAKWQPYISGELSANRYICGIESTPKGDAIIDNRLDNANEYSCAYFGASGSGKTQAMTSALLSLCATTSPDSLAVIVIDPKGIDLPLDGLPHLACPVITDTNKARSAVLDVAEILKTRAERKDRAASQKRILIVVDELKYLLSQQDDDQLIDALANLAAMGRAWGISMFIGSQRGTNEYFPKRVHSQFPARWLGRMTDQSEAVFAGGAGCDAHRLPGKGSALLYEPDGIARIQSTYIGDASKDSYPAVLAEYIEDCKKRWDGAMVHWRLGEDDSGGATVQPVSSDLSAMVEDAVRRVLLEMANVRPADDDDVDLSILDTIPSDVIDAWQTAYDEAPGAFNQQRLREVYKEIVGKRLNTAKEKEVYQAFIVYAQE